VIALGILGVLAIVAVIAFPRVGNWYVRTRALPRVEARLGRQISAGSIRVRWGEIELTRVVIHGRSADDPPLAEIERIHATYQPWAALRGRLVLGEITIEGPTGRLVVQADGTDNFSDVIDSLRRPSAGGTSEPAQGRSRFTRLTVVNGSGAFDDARRGMTVVIGRVDATVFAPDAPISQPGDVTVTLQMVEASSRMGPSARAEQVVLRTALPDWRKGLGLEVAGGRVTPWRDLALTGIRGKVAPDPAEGFGRVHVDLVGGWGGAPEELWKAEGWYDHPGKKGEMHLVADRFSFEKLAPVLVGTPVLHPEKTSLDATLDLGLDGDKLTFSGGFHLSGLTVYTPRIAEEPVPDLSFSAAVEGGYDRGTRRFELSRADLDFRGVKASLKAHLALPGGPAEPPLPPQPKYQKPGRRRATPPAPPVDTPVATSIRTTRRLKVHFVVPPVPCQTALLALPAQVVPSMVGFQLAGMFTTDVEVDIDWADLENLLFEPRVGIDGCRIRAVPMAVDARRLEREFTHRVQVTHDDWLEFDIGPSNPDFVPLDEISPHLVNSIMSTEDSSFFRHHGFLPREFRGALVKNLQAGKFRYGASSITMQFVKNVLLGRKKTLSRKLQELFLTWYVEQALDKERILEIYLNAIEFGPGIFGIGKAARHYFDKNASELNPVEAAFFSSILPDPKGRHMQYCDGALTRWTQEKVIRILKIMYERERLTEPEYLGALATPLAFAYPDDFDGRRCRRDSQRIIDATPPTSPVPTDPEPVEDAGDL
jgi:hypothetical protein